MASYIPSKEGPIFHTPKTNKSRRSIVVSNVILSELEKLKSQQDALKKLLGDAYYDNDLVTCSNNGCPINPASFSHTFARVLKRNDFPHLRFHDLRHPYVKYTPKKI